MEAQKEEVTYDVARLLESATQVELSNPSDEKQGSFHHGYRRNKAHVESVFEWVLKDFEPVKNVWLSHIEPGGYIPPHKDASPWLERWQIPIQPSGVFIIDGEEQEQVAGVPFRVAQWEWHSVTVGDTPRVHLVVDRDIVAHAGTARFEGAMGTDELRARL